jgi:peptide/nickel transport system ATP-binding protein
MTLLDVTDVNTWFGSKQGPVRAVDGVSLQLERGRTLGLVGESGSGKSAFVRSIMRLHHPASVARYDGRILFDGTDLATLGARDLRAYWGPRIGIVFQNPMTSLNPVVRIGRQLTETLRAHLGLDRRAARERAIELLTWVGIADPERRLRAYPHEFSGGMRQRVAIAIALACEPELLIADEPTTALDVTVQTQILALLNRIQRERGMSMIVVTHDLGVVAGIADEVAVMYAGRIVEHGATADVVERPRMPYTGALLASIPRIDAPSQSRLPTIPGRMPSLVASEGARGCPFAPRCAHATDRCMVEQPPLAQDDHGDQSFACWHPLTPASHAPVAQEMES